MREKRKYRKEELGYPTIKFELESYLQNKKFLAYVRQALRFFGDSNDADLKEILIEKALTAVDSIDRMIRKIPDLSLIEWVGANEATGNQYLLLEQLIAQVWEHHFDKVMDEYQSFLEQDYNHSSRK